MTYDCINGWEDVFAAAENNLNLPRSLDTDETSEAAATICEAIVTAGRQVKAARAMLAALIEACNEITNPGFHRACKPNSDQDIVEYLQATIKAAKAAGIKAD